jgi:hypothetical protein
MRRIFWDVAQCDPHDATSQKTVFFIVTAVKTSNPASYTEVRITKFHLHKLWIIFTKPETVPVSRMWILARPASSSKAASDTLRSVFHDEINR